MKPIGVVAILFSLLLSTHQANADIRLWLSTSTTDGNIGGRAGADALCDADANRPVIAASTTRAFLSVDAADEVRDMVVNYTVPTNETIFQVDGTTQIAANFAALLNTDTTPLLNIVGGATDVYTGTLPDGSLATTSSNHCVNWTSTAGTGRTGSSNEVSQFYISSGGATCALSGPLYCITYSAPVAAVANMSPTTITTTEGGSSATYQVVLNQAPSAGETVTVTPASNDLTEGTVSSPINYDNTNWSTPQIITITPGAAGDGNDGDVAYTITNTVSAVGGIAYFNGAAASDVAVTNQNVDGVDVIIVSPSSGMALSINEGSFVDVTISSGPTPTSDVTVDVSTSSTEISLSTASVTLNAGNGYSATLRITAIADAFADADAAFTVVTAASVSADPAFTGINPVDIAGVAVNADAASDNDNLPDLLECPTFPSSCVDTDGDSDADFIDTDSDGDNFPDIVEAFATLDSDSDGIGNGLDVDDTSVTGRVDTNMDGIDDRMPSDIDGDGVPNHLDSDSDNDGTNDNLDTPLTITLLGVDADMDGVDDAYDSDFATATGATGIDANGDGYDDGIIATLYSEANPTLDTDDIPDIFDADQDNAAGTTDLSGDSDNDGLSDLAECPVFSLQASNNCPDSDSDGVPDYQDAAATSGGGIVTPFILMLLLGLLGLRKRALSQQL